MDASMVEVAERVPVFAEAQMLARSTANPMELRVRTEAYLKAGHATFTDGPVNFQQEPYLSQHLSSLRICDLQLSSQVMHMLARPGNVSPSSIPSRPLLCSPTANAKPAHALQNPRMRRL